MSWEEQVRLIGEQRGEQKGKQIMAKGMYDMGITIEKIAEIANYPVEVVKKWLNLD